MKKSVLIILTSAICVIVLVCTAVCAFFITRALLPKTPVEIDNNKNDKNDDNSPLTVKTLALNLTSVTATTTASTQEKLLTVTPTPSTADIEIDWSVAFKNPSSTWASGKNVSNYVDLSPVVGKPQAKIKALAAFSEPVIITAALKADNSIKATCLCDYRIAIQGFDLVFANESVYNNFSITTNGLAGVSNISAGTSLYSSFTNITYGDGTLMPSASPTVTKVQLVVDGNKLYTYLNLLFAGETLPDLASITLSRSGTYDLHTFVNGYIYKNLNSLYTLFNTICSEISEDEESDLKQIAQKINNDLKAHKDSSGKYVAKSINGLSLKYTLSDSTTLSVPVRYVYNPNLSVT